jgi:predicted transcriptional regulator
LKEAALPATTTVRITQDTSQTLRDLASATGRSMQDVLAQAVEAYSRQLLLDEVNEAYAALRADPKGWREELDERAAWEATLLDDLERD